MRPLLLVLMSLFLGCFLSCEARTLENTDAGTPPEQALTEIENKPIKCGNATCPGAHFECCQELTSAPPSCCPKGLAICRSGKAALGWPDFNECNLLRCQSSRPKHCTGFRRNTCCKADEKCGDAFGYAYCIKEDCPKDKTCFGGRLCCEQANTCKPFKNSEYCADNCTEIGKEKCAINTKHYGTDQEFYLCCNIGECRNHPDGWPYCLGELY